MADKLVKGVGCLIGLATEASAARKASKAARLTDDHDTIPHKPFGDIKDEPSTPPVRARRSTRTGNYEPAKNRKFDEGRAHRSYDSLHGQADDPSPPPYSVGEISLENDETSWQLDDAVEEEEREDEISQHLDKTSISVDPGPVSSSKEGRQHYVDNIVHTFLAKYPTARPAGSSDATGLLPCPVIIPQRRPHDKKRGFIRAYAPVLQPCGIDQEAFLSFLKAMHQSSKASPIFSVINIASLVAGVVPSITAQIVSAVAQAAALAAIEVQGNMRTNNFLTQMNLAYFRPRGLFCLIFKYKPEDAATHEAVDISSTILKTINPSSSRFKHTITNASRASASTTDEMAFPEVAPLVFPALDDTYTRADTPNTTKESMKRKGKFVANYLDKRAQATYAAQNPNSVLANANTQEHRFASRFADPNHPANNGNPIALLTGGLINPKSEQEKYPRKGERAGLLSNRISKHGGRGQSGGGPLGLVSSLASIALASRDGQSPSYSNANPPTPYGVSVPSTDDTRAQWDGKRDETHLQSHVDSNQASPNQAGRSQRPSGMIKRMLKPVGLSPFWKCLSMGRCDRLTSRTERSLPHGCKHAIRKRNGRCKGDASGNWEYVKLRMPTFERGIHRGKFQVIELNDNY